MRHSHYLGEYPICSGWPKVKQSLYGFLLASVLCPRWRTSWAQEPVSLHDVGVFVLQMSVGPDQALGGEHHLVFSLLELPEQLFGTRGENHIVAVSRRRIKKKEDLLLCVAQPCEYKWRGFICRVKLPVVTFICIKCVHVSPEHPHQSVYMLAGSLLWRMKK